MPAKKAKKTPGTKKSNRLQKQKELQAVRPLTIVLPYSDPKMMYTKQK